MSAIAVRSAPSFPAGGALQNLACWPGAPTHTQSRSAPGGLAVRQRRELLMLDGVELRDLSVTQADVDREARKPFWEGIQLTGR